ncbi:hypothetical protein [Sphingobium algorifonticola]|uniref:STAS/SEC14 domain-containing protein n=1 Tax=Sphingobium algorifonticola TaxID=2008318 RepID=A0A437J890_9SPHN|nr:hypothetical protein [Sphingobium algorifonticola]RVT41718.1 hypothetical protein ENE74_05360 [Sphingobium algorifonticola]
MDKFDIVTEPAYKLIRATLSGFFDGATVAQFGRAVQMASAGMGCQSGEHLLLVDTTRCALQAQDVVGAFQALITDSPLKSKRIAIVTGSSLSRMQVRRILVRDQAMMFDNAADAEQWVLTGTLGAQAA